MANSSPPRPRPERNSPAPGWRRQAFPLSDPLERPDDDDDNDAAATAAGASRFDAVSDFLQETRNSPEAHRRHYAHAQREHRRVLDQALHVFELHQLAEANRAIEEEERRRAARVAEEARRIEAERRAKIKQMEDEARLAAQKAAPLPKPAPPPPPVQPPPQAEEEKKPQQQQQQPQQPQQEPPASAPAPTPATANPFAKAAATTNGTAANPFASTAATAVRPPTETETAAAPSQAANGSAAPPVKPPPAAATAAATPAADAAAAAPPAPIPDRHMEVHKNLKLLRAFVGEQGRANPALKSRVGDMRRDIRKSFGQLTSGGLKENRIPIQRIVSTLVAGLKEVPSALVDPSQFVLAPRPTPAEGALHNEAQLPSLYLYLLNILAKAAISQFINESGADPRTAEAIGQAVVKVYSEPEFLWRGQPMIDMLVAKFRVVCPVLFGFSGDDRTERGRVAVGWRREGEGGGAGGGGRWIAEQYHIDRMTGLGAGFAAITLRDFSRVKRASPWPPTVYWTALARIVNTPAAAMSETQCYVLKAMIADNEAKFVGFYGHAALAALRCALVDYPARMPRPTAASETLKVLARTIKVRTGLDLEQI